MRIRHIAPNIEAHNTTGQPRSGKIGPVAQRRPTSPIDIHQYLVIEENSGHLRITAPEYELNVPMLVVRHGQTNGNLKWQFQGQIDEADHALNATGREQVRQGAQRVYAMLRDLFGAQFMNMIESGAFVLLHSPLSRARDTAQAFIDHVTEQTGATLSAGVEQRLSEMDFGILEGRTIEEAAEDTELYNQALRYRAEDASMNWKGTGESFLDVVTRGREWLDAVNAEHGKHRKLVIAFSHGITINAIRTLFRDPAFVDEHGAVAFRKHILDNAEAYWLGESQRLAERTFLV